MIRNKHLIMKRSPTEYPVPGRDITIMVGLFDLRKPPPLGGLIVKLIYAALEPYQRTSMSRDRVLYRLNSFTVGHPISGMGVAQVIKTSHPGFRKGDFVCGLLLVQEYSTIPSESLPLITRIFDQYNVGLMNFVGVLGFSGLAAYGCLHLLEEFRKGEVIYISSAAGAVGHVAGQLAKLEGLKVIGSVGSDEKLSYIINELKFDFGFNYKTEKPLDALRRLVPGGINIYFDNVGGEQLEAALESIKPRGRILCCGMICDYNKTPDTRYGIKNWMNVIIKGLTVQGFMVTRYFKNNSKDYRPLVEKLSRYLAEGKIKTKGTVYRGIEYGPEAFLGMLIGESIGKSVLQVSKV